MSSAYERHEARLVGSTKAIERWMTLQLDPGRPVDIFGIIEREAIWLLFEQLRSLFGFFDRSDGATGVVLNSQLPLSVQRFTAAHEYGHFLLGHERSLDTQREVLGAEAGLDLTEIAAQAFAAEFMMPLALVNRALDRVSLPREPHGLSSLHAYQLALEMGSSYTATITQLRQVKKIRADDLARLQKTEPIDVKVEVGGGRRPLDPRSDVWLVTDRTPQRRMELREGDELHIRVPEMPSTGYRWMVTTDGIDEALELVADELEPVATSDSRIGAERRRHLWWRATRAGAGRLTVTLRRRWREPTDSPADALDLVLLIREPLFDPAVGGGISESQRVAYLRRVEA
jgi:predicted secreted protein